MVDTDMKWVIEGQIPVFKVNDGFPWTKYHSTYRYFNTSAYQKLSVSSINPSFDFTVSVTFQMPAKPTGADRNF